MTFVTTTKQQSRQSIESTGAGRGQAPPRPIVPRRRRRPVMVVVGILLCLTGGSVGGWLATNVGDTQAVLALERPVVYGAPVRDADLRVVRIRTDPGLSVVPASQQRDVVGKFAATDLERGALLTQDSVTSNRVPGPGEELVGVAVDASRMPNRPLHAQDQVLVVTTPPEDADPTDEQPHGVEATVVSVGRPDDDGVRVVDVRVPAGAGASLAARAATGRIALVLEFPGG